MIQKIKTFILGLFAGVIALFVLTRYQKSNKLKQVEEKDKEIKKQAADIENKIKAIDKDIKKVDNKLNNISEDENWHLKR